MEKRKFRKLTDNDRNAIIFLYKTGRAARDIAVFMSIDPSTVHKVLRDNEIAAHYPERAEGARQRHEAARQNPIEKRPAEIIKETPEMSGQISFEEINLYPREVTPINELFTDNDTFGDDLEKIIYKAVYNAMTDVHKNGYK